MKKSILILTVSTFYLIACGDSTDNHSHEDDGGHSHGESGEHHDHDGNDHNHNNEQEDFVVEPTDSILDTATTSKVSITDPVPNEELPKEHVHDGHDHNHGDHKD
ncbi:MAG: hypothetical protein ACJA0U_000818 [Salibacteraceae bacterium]|jgi:hypothetical protein